MSDSRWRHINSIVAVLFAVLILVCVVGLVWNVAALQTRNNLREEHYSREYAARAEQEIQSSCIGLDQAATTECIREIIEATHEAQRSEYDLSAQEEMARWAFWMLVASTATLIVTAAGVYFVRETLAEAGRTTRAAIASADAALATVDESRKATQAARDGADAAVAANRIAQQSFREQGRPYILVQPMANNVRIWTYSDTGWFEWPFKIRHYGEKPAIVDSVHYICSVSDAIPAMGPWYELPLSSKVVAGEVASLVFAEGRKYEFTDLVLGPHPYKGRPALKECYDAWFEDRIFVWLLVVVRYRDVFNVMHETRSCFRQHFPHYRAEEFGGPEYNYRT